jgi:hypothetical protein
VEDVELTRRGEALHNEIAEFSEAVLTMDLDEAAEVERRLTLQFLELMEAYEKLRMPTRVERRDEARLASAR